MLQLRPSNTLQHGQMRKDRIALEHDAAIRHRAQASSGSPSTRILPARRPLLAEQHAQERGLAAAGRADKRDEGARLDVERDLLEHDLVAVLLPDIVEADPAHAALTDANQGNALRWSRRSPASIRKASSVIQMT